MLWLMNRNGYTFDEAVSAEVRAQIARTPGMTVVALAKLLNVRRATLASRVNGHTPFRPAELHAVARRIGVRASDLIARAEATFDIERSTPSTDPASVEDVEVGAA